MKTPTKKQIEEELKVVRNLEKKMHEEMLSQLEAEKKLSNQFMAQNEKDILELIKGAGLDVDKHKRQNDEEKKIMKKNIEEIKKSQLKPIEIPDYSINEITGYSIEASVLGIETDELRPPAYGCESDGNLCLCDKERGRMRPLVEAEGYGAGMFDDGWDYGYGGCSLSWFYIPLQNGKMKVSVHFDAHGRYGQHVSDKWYTSSHAHQTLQFLLDIYRNGEMIAQEWFYIIDSGNQSTYMRRLDKEYYLSTGYFNVGDGDLIWIIPRVNAYVRAKSNRAWSYLDFHTNPYNYVRVEKLMVQVHRPFAHPVES